MEEHIIYSFAKDTKPKDASVTYKAHHNALGIDVDYKIRDDEITYKKHFATSEDAVTYLQENPIVYTEEERKKMKDVLDTCSTFIPESNLYRGGFDMDTINDVNSYAQPQNIRQVLTKLPCIMTTNDLPSEIIENPFYFLEQDIITVLTNKSKIVKEILLAFQPFIICKLHDRTHVTGNEIDMLIRETGIFIDRVVNSNVSETFILHCKMEEIELIDESITQDDNYFIPEIEKKKLEEKPNKEKSTGKYELNIPIIKDTIRDVMVDVANEESVNDYVQTHLELKIILKEIDPDKKRKDDKLFNRIFVFVSFFFV
jgi:hypothetical protein